MSKAGDILNEAGSDELPNSPKKPKKPKKQSLNRVSVIEGILFCLETLSGWSEEDMNEMWTDEDLMACKEAFIKIGIWEDCDAD